MAKTRPKAKQQRESAPASIDAPTNARSNVTPGERLPEDLPIDPRHFWSAGEAWESLTPPPEAEVRAALELLGPFPIPRGGFPLMGFLATIYDHVAAALQSEPDARGDAP